MQRFVRVADKKLHVKLRQRLRRVNMHLRLIHGQAILCRVQTLQPPIHNPECNSNMFLRLQLRVTGVRAVVRTVRLLLIRGFLPPDG